LSFHGEFQNVLTVWHDNIKIVTACEQQQLDIPPLVKQYKKLIEKKLSLLLQAEPKPHYGEVIYTANPDGQILIDTTHLNKPDSIALAVPASLTAELGPANQPAAPAPSSSPLSLVEACWPC
jgi:hypothetical protein